MSRNKLADLSDHLFAQLERLGDEEIDDNRLRLEIARAGALSSVAGTIISAGDLALKASRLRTENGTLAHLPNLLGLDQSGA